MSYAHEYCLPGGKKSLLAYSRPFNLARYKPARWVTATDDLDWLMDALDNSPHVPVAPTRAHEDAPALVLGRTAWRKMWSSGPARTSAKAKVAKKTPRGYRVTSFVFRRQLTIAWGHCDPAGIVFNPRFFEMFDANSWMLFEAALGVKAHDLARTYGIIGIALVDAQGQFPQAGEVRRPDRNRLARAPNSAVPASTSSTS